MQGRSALLLERSREQLEGVLAAVGAAEAFEAAPGGEVRAVVSDGLRCVFGGMGVGACPCDAIRMDTGLHPAAYDSRQQFIFQRETLIELSGRDGARRTANPRHEPGDPSYPGLTREHDH